MNLLKDIKKIVGKDKEHNLKIEIDGWRIRILLDYDPEDKMEENCMIPIEYDVFEQFAYIPDDAYRKMFKPCDYGIDSHEISMIKSIMEYLEKHSDEISDLCCGFCWNDRRILQQQGEEA